MPGGRPKKDNPRNQDLNIRLTKDEAQRIKDCAEAVGKSRTDTIMQGIELLEEKIKKK